MKAYGIMGQVPICWCHA